MKRFLVFLLFVVLPFILFGQPNLKVGILSDVHIHKGDGDSETLLKKALTYYRNADVDAVMVVGDMCNCGMEKELSDFMDIYKSVFPKDRGMNGKKVERLFVTGNHEIVAHTYPFVKDHYSPEELKDGCISPRLEKVWKTYFKEPYSTFFIKTIKGYVFVGGMYLGKNDKQSIGEFFDENDSKIPRDKPFFYFQHQPPKNTCSGPTVFGQDNGESTEVLSRYPNVIAFAGHSHVSLTDEKTIWQGTFTCVGTASLRNAHSNDKGYENGKLGKGVSSQMKRMGGYESHQGMLMSVFDDRVELLRHEFGNDEDLGVWIIPVGPDVEKPYTFEARMNNIPAPEFGSEDKVNLEEKSNGKDRNGELTEQLVVRFPSVGAKNDRPRSYTFLINVEIVSGETSTVFKSKSIIGQGSNLGEKADANMDSYCRFAS